MEHTDIQTLASRVEGPVLLPGDEGYDEERTGANLAVRRELELIVGAARGGVLVTASRMTGVEVDPDRRTVRVGAGVRFEQVIPATVPHELAPLNGSAPHVGVVSYVLGGGVGLLVRTYGYASDRVRGLELVTADGELRRVTADSEPDLYRAVVGGGGRPRRLRLYEKLFEALAPVSSGARLTFLGFGANAGENRVRAPYAPADLERLTRLKTVHDPQNLFRLTYNVPPAATDAASAN